MSYCLSEIKYRITQLIRSSSYFSIHDIVSELSDTLNLKDAIYAVLGELIDKGIIEITSRTKLNDKMQRPVKIYYFNCEDYCAVDKIENYLSELNYSRTQPDIFGKPRTLNFQLAEEFLNKVKNSSEESREYLLASVHRYLGLAQIDETSKDLYDNPHQKELSEAYIRSMYADYMLIKDDQQWLLVIIQLLKSVKLFMGSQNLSMSSSCELRACEILIKKFNAVINSQSSYSIDNHMEFTKSMEQIAEFLFNEEFNPTTFNFICGQILSKIQHRIDTLKRKNGELSQIVQYGSTIAETYGNSVISPIFNMLNLARLELIRSGNRESINLRLNAKKYLEEAELMLENLSSEVESMNFASIKSIIDDHLQAVDFYLNVTEASFLSSIDRFKKLASLNFGNSLPFYWVDNLQLLLSTINQTNITKNFDLATNQEEKHSFSADKLGIKADESQLYSPDDFDDITGIDTSVRFRDYEKRTISSNYKAKVDIPTISSQFYLDNEQIEDELIITRSVFSADLHEKNIDLFYDVGEKLGVELRLFAIQDTTYKTKHEYDLYHELSILPSGRRQEKSLCSTFQINKSKPY